MSGAYPTNMAAHAPCRSLHQLHAELVARYAAMPETHYAARGKLLVRIRDVEAAIDEAGK